MSVSVLARGKFIELPDAKRTSVGPNATQIRVSVPIRGVRRGPTAEDWDGAVFLLDDVESEPAVGSGEGPGWVEVTVLTF